MELNEGIHKALDGNALLFVGAGFSAGAKDIEGNDFVTGSRLAKLLAKECELEQEVQLNDISDLYLQKFGTEKLINLLITKFTASQVSSFQRNIAQIPWKRIYTTNYDNVIEESYRAEQKKIIPITLKNNNYQTPKNQTLCVHLNGYIGELNRETIFNELKLTQTSYITSSIESSRWISEFKYDIELADAVFFLGFSLYDLDIARILRDSKLLKEKCFFIIGFNDDPITQMRVSPFGTPLNLSVRNFSDKVSKERLSYVPVEKSRFSTLSVSEKFLEGESISLSDRDFFNFLLYGEYTSAQILESIKTGEKFYLERYQISTIFQIIEDGGRIFTIDSDFGNGKTLFVEGLHQKFLQKGYRVFAVNEQSTHTNKELEQLARLEEKILITFEQYGRWLNEIELFCLNSTENAVVILTDRSSNHDVILETLERKVGEREIYEINLNILNQAETDWFIDVFNTYGAWGEYAGDNINKKHRYLTETCKSQIHAILLSLLDSPDLKKRLNQISDDIKKNNTHFDILLSIFILVVINYEPTLGLLSDVWGVEIINRTNFRRDKAVSQLINFDSDKILLKSSVVSRYFIKNFVDANKIVSVLLTLTKRASNLHLSDRYPDILKNLIKFSNVQAVFPDKGLRQGAIDYYENIKNLPQCKMNPLFWLQYAIACTTTHEIVRAKKYFENAYSFANNLDNYNVFQIDNHYARFLLVEAMETLPATKSMDNFRKAHNINKRQLNFVDRKKYPFRVALNYRPFFDKFGSSLNISEIEELEMAFRFILEKIFYLPEHQQKSDPMKSCKRDMEILIQETKTRLSESNTYNQSSTEKS